MRLLVTAWLMIVQASCWALYAAFTGAIILFFWMAAWLVVGLWMLGDTLEARARGRS